MERQAIRSRSQRPRDRAGSHAARASRCRRPTAPASPAPPEAFHSQAIDRYVRGFGARKSSRHDGPAHQPLRRLSAISLGVLRVEGGLKRGPLVLAAIGCALVLAASRAASQPIATGGAAL